MIYDLTKALESNQESDRLDFKRSFDVSSAGEWCEIIKDIIAMANSGGGVIIIGLENDGRLSNIDVSSVLSLDPANVTNKVYKYTDIQFCDFEIIAIEKEGVKLAAIVIKGVPVPIIFTSPGTYAIDSKQQKTSFSKGTVYFRHGAKSDPGNMHDLRNFLERELTVIRESWLSGIRKVVEAPPGSHVAVLPAEFRDSESSDAIPIRLVDDPDAPAYRNIDPDVSYPNRQMDVIKRVNEYLGEKKINSFDFRCVKEICEIVTNPKFYYKMRFTSPRYSNSFVEWLIEQHKKDVEFFEKVKGEYWSRKNLA